MSALADALCGWFRERRRDLPWRRTRDPYAVWVSEMMLQQTQVATVVPYYDRWMRRFPDVQALARASEDDVLKLWQGLGYYRRARNLLAGARVVVERHRGVVPRSVSELEALPGIGPYSAGAIASIAYDEPVPLVDGNVIRVLCRLFALRGDPTRAPLRGELWQLARSLIPEGDAATFNQALMELGATICTPRQPRCETCPVRAHCEAHRQELVSLLPELAERPRVVPVTMVAALVERQKRWLVVKRPPTAQRWAGMWQFPNVELGAGEAPDRAAARAVRENVGISVAVAELRRTLRHSVTHYRITLHAYACAKPRGIARAESCAAFAYVSADELSELAMPSAHRRLAREIVHEGAEFSAR